MASCTRSRPRQAAAPPGRRIPPNLSPDPTTHLIGRRRPHCRLPRSRPDF
uniref:Uncharacterized protein n=1 Tax=Arundo donax TaxID=35708 RepID=A0A0A9AVK6_ARUDO